MSDTPETDAARVMDTRTWRGGSAVHVELARRLERERDAFAKLLVADCNLLVAERDKARAERDDARADAERLRALLNETLVTMRHASVFVRSREQMHQTGVRLWDALIAAIDAALAQDTQCFCDAKGLGEPGVTCGDCPRDYKRRSDAALAPKEGGR